MSNPHIELGREQLGQDEEQDPFTEADEESTTYEDDQPELPEHREQQ